MSSYTKNPDDILHDAAIFLIEEYRQRPGNFLSCFMKYKSFRGLCDIISNYIGRVSIDEGAEKKITEWANRQPLSVNDKNTLSNLLFLFYDILNLKKNDNVTVKH